MSESTPICNKRKRAFRSWVWKFFSLIDEKEERYQCTKCSFHFVHIQGGSTTSMIYHLSHEHQIYKHNESDNRT